MKSLKQYIGYLVAFLSALSGFLLFLLFRKDKENESLQADLDLTVQSEKSKIVDKEVGSAQKEIDAISQEMKKPPTDSDKFWDDYDKGSK